MRARIWIPRLAVLVSIGLFVAGCGGGSGSGSGSTSETGNGGEQISGEAPSEAQAAATGDIPDNQVFLVFKNSAAGYSIRYPEGWARTGAGNDVSFEEKANAIHIVVSKGSPRSKPGEKVTLHRQSAPDPVTGKQLPLSVDRYEYGRGGKVAVLELATPVGVDNVDAYRLISESFKWQ